MFREIFLKMLRLSTLLLLTMLFSGCGYKIGNMGHPQLKSVAIAPVVNDTLAYNAAANMRGQLAECFQTDGTMKLTQHKKSCRSRSQSGRRDLAYHGGSGTAYRTVSARRSQLLLLGKTHFHPHCKRRRHCKIH